ncbi:MAG: 3'(2'),5'-bisphosphate nucleotidase CysQ [Rikenellaceae bacterium]|jgi:3'(2'), 5'-bisphosphate nucleotidase|nr:3'(2'),5'-bisphosphate nucleotidase CysQ [Rikenellaceae bacterium]
MLQREQIDFLLANAYNAAIRAGAKILDIYNHEEDFHINLKSDSTPITVADRAAHTLIKSYLGKTRIPLMSEEGRHILYEERGNWDLYWLVDPLDGTREFIKRNGEFTVNIALMVDNRPVMGVIYYPCFEKIYFSDPERGAFRKENIFPDPEADFSIAGIFDGAQQLPLEDDPGRPVSVVISRSHLTPETHRFVEYLRERYGEVEVIESGSSVKFCLVAEGRADFYVRTTSTSEWDVAAGDSIAMATGAHTHALGDENARLEYNKESLENPRFVCCRKGITV